MNPPFSPPRPSTSAAVAVRVDRGGALGAAVGAPTDLVGVGPEVAEAAVVEPGVALVAGPGPPAVPVAAELKRRFGAVVRLN